MTGPRKTRIQIDRLRVTGAGPAEAEALVHALRRELAAQLQAAPGGVRVADTDRLRITAPGAASAADPAQRGAALGQQIAAALSRGKAGDA